VAAKIFTIPLAAFAAREKSQVPAMIAATLSNPARIAMPLAVSRTERGRGSVMSLMPMVGSKRRAGETSGVAAAGFFCRSRRLHQTRAGSRDRIPRLQNLSTRLDFLETTSLSDVEPLAVTIANPLVRNSVWTAVFVFIRAGADDSSGVSERQSAAGK
jgi:hypothetical protein